MKSLIISLIAAGTVGAAAQAEPLAGKDVEALFGAGSMRLTAGSVGKFKGDGSYTFDHGSKTQRGTYKVDPAGVVTFKDGATDHGFILDKNPKGKIDLIYVSGPQKGAKYRLR